MAETENWIETYSGKKFCIDALDEKNIDIADIAHALANTCRYGGHCKYFYSVAQHAVLTSVLCKDAGCSVWDRFAALHHDDVEAYLADMPRPIKRILPDYKSLEKKLDLFLEEVFKFVKSDTVIWADSWMLEFERRLLLIPQAWPGLESYLNSSKTPTATGFHYLVQQSGLYPQHVKSQTEWYFWSPTVAESAFLNLHHSLMNERQNAC